MITGQDLIKKHGIADAHFDMGKVLYSARMRGVKHPMSELLLPEWTKCNVKAIIAAVFIDNADLPEKALPTALTQIAILHEEIAKNTQDVSFVASANELDEALAANKVAILLSLEGLEPIGTNLHMLEIFHKLGVRFAGLVWSRQNAVGDGSRFQGRESGNGLTTFGFDVIKKMWELRIALDVSHLNDEGFEDVVKEFGGTVLASHSNARAVNNIKRNITDEQAKFLHSRGGIIGINGIKPILASGFESMSQEDIIRVIADHIDHYKATTGTDCICLGLDRCDLLDEMRLRYGNHENNPVDAITKYEEIALIADELISRGYSQGDVSGILAGNLIAFLRGLLGK